MADGQALTPDQSYALFDILSHAETYQEIRDFRHPGSLKDYGPPFDTPSQKISSAPGLQALVSRFLSRLPGLKDVPDDFWKVQIATIIDDFEKVNLSESYDKGILGSRKTVSTALSALIEYPLRGTFGGFQQLKNYEKNYDLSKAEDLSRAFRDFLNETVYGGIIEETVLKASETDQLTDHDPILQAMHEFVLVNLASFMHYTLILSPKGQYLLKLIDNANKMVPYLVIRQTLKIGNVASMINAMMKVVLAKMSLTSMTNWIGLTSSADDGMNLLQHIISTVLTWDNSELQKRASKIEKERSGESRKKQLHVLKSYPGCSIEDQTRLRHESETNTKSIVTVILEDAGVTSDLTAEQHSQALEYVSIHLSIRDRKQIIQVLCRSQPDHLTQSLREIVSAYEPVIRHVHNAVDLSDTIYDLERFVHDTIKISKVHTDKQGKSVVPTVGDFVTLLRKHQYSSHKFIHQCCKNGSEVTGWYMEWGKMAAAEFRRTETPSSSQPNSETANTQPKGLGAGIAAGALTDDLTKQFLSLPASTQHLLLPILAQHAKYLDILHISSLSRLDAVMHSPATTATPSASSSSHHHIPHHPHAPSHISRILNSSTSRPSSRSASPAPASDKSPLHDQSSTSTLTAADSSAQPPPIITPTAGPGSFLARWQSLLDTTAITPATATGPVRYGSNLDVKNDSSEDVDGGRLAELTIQERSAGEGQVEVTKRPDVRPVVDAMGTGFRELLGRLGCNW